MPVSKEMRLLLKKWNSGSGWPKRLDAIELTGVRGWSGQRIEFPFPIMALVGENGAGKSTVLQAAASVYRPPESSGERARFASDFFPETPWERIPSATIKWWVREGHEVRSGSIRKFQERWRGNPDRRQRLVKMIDLSRIQPVPARVGYSRLAKAKVKPATSVPFDNKNLSNFSEIMGRSYEVASMSNSEIDNKRFVPVVTRDGKQYSGFHSGAGETTMVELLRSQIPAYSLVLIDEIETSLHPRSQRRLVRHLAELCRQMDLQIVISTHSPYVLEELPEEARLYIWEGASGREVIKGVSPQFAMTKMDLEQHPECDVYVEDNQAKVLLREILVVHAPALVPRCLISPYGAASVGLSLGQMAAGKRFPRPTCVFVDGDQSGGPGCEVLPGGDAPEVVVFEALRVAGWDGVAARVGRSHSQLADACNKAMTSDDHHDWIQLAADELTLSGDTLWQAMCSVWAKCHLDTAVGISVADSIEVSLR